MTEGAGMLTVLGGKTPAQQIKLLRQKCNEVICKNTTSYERFIMRPREPKVTGSKGNTQRKKKINGTQCFSEHRAHTNPHTLTHCQVINALNKNVVPVKGELKVQT